MEIVFCYVVSNEQVWLAFNGLDDEREVIPRLCLTMLMMTFGVVEMDTHVASTIGVKAMT